MKTTTIQKLDALTARLENFTKKYGTTPDDEDDGEEFDFLTDEEAQAIESHIGNAAGENRLRVRGLLRLADVLDQHGAHPQALHVLRRLAATGSPPQTDGGPGRALDGSVRNLSAVADLDAQVDAALDRAQITDTARRIGAKLEASRTGRLPSWLPPEPQEITAASPLLDRVNARLNELNTDPIVRIALKMQAAMEGKEPEILRDEQRMNGLRRRDDGSG